MCCFETNVDAFGTQAQNEIPNLISYITQVILVKKYVSSYALLVRALPSKTTEGHLVQWQQSNQLPHCFENLLANSSVSEENSM